MFLKSVFLTALSVLATLTSFAGGSNTIANFSLSETSINRGRTVTFTDLSTKGTCSALIGWEWNFGEGASPATASTQGPHTVTYTTVGEKSISLQAIGEGICLSRTNRKILTVNEPPIPTMSQWSMFILGLLIMSIAVGRIWLAVKNPM